MTTTPITTNEYDWDAENRLVELTQWTNGVKFSSLFSYDGFGRRVKIVEESNGVVMSTKQYVWDSVQLCEERDASDNVTKRFFAYGEQINGHDYYFTKDHLGSIREMIDEDGELRARYDYDPYGRRTKVQGDLDADFGFTGYYVHQPSGLQMAPYRAYDADIGRFINRDPIGEAGGLNLYDYVQNNPINDFDPEGLDGAAAKCACKAGARLLATEEAEGWAAGGNFDPYVDGVILATAIGLVGYTTYEYLKPACMSRGHGERGIQGKDPNPWKGYRPKDPNDPSKGGWKKDPQTGKWKPVPRPPGPPPKNHPNW